MKKTKRRHARHVWNPFHWHSWIIWLGGILTISLYVLGLYHFFVNPFSFRWKGIFGDTTNPSGYYIRGLDISHYQGTIDWTKLRNAYINEEPVRFVFIKATEGTDLLDEYFNENFYQARENNIIRGAYHFFLPSESPVAQAKYFLRQVHLEEGDLPPVLDIEHSGNLTKAQVAKAALKWLNIVEERYGVKPIIYTNYSFKLEYLSDSIFNDYPYWIAHYYVDTLKYDKPWKFWQYTDCGNVKGIKGKVDFNIYNGSMYDLQRFTIMRKDDE